MNFLTDFFRQLFLSRVSGAQVSAMGKAYSVQARAKSKVAGKFNQVVDKGVAKVANPVKGAIKGRQGGQGPSQGGAKSAGGPPGAGGGEKEKKKMGFFSFGKKTSREPAVQAGDEGEGEAKTQAINISQFEDTNFKPCVGWVVIMEGAQKGRDFRLVPGRNRLGTDADMEVVLTDPYVSSHHATLVYNDEGLWNLSDAGSTNGTKVNGKRVMQAVVVDNDTLTIGHTVLRFKALD
ncbi:MAG: FHA domain-containing protein [Deltaproteobacteria bacterium]|nr:FHA domain-containing protein [Deltaproteobacteria bacterium]